MESTEEHDASRKWLFAGGGLVGAILASSCCIAPLLLLTLGVSGAWMSNLTALAPYQGYFIAATLVFLGAGYWHVYFKPRADCGDSSYCASTRANTVMKLVLWAATALIVLALGVNFIVPLFL